jgi:hypothetical protein
MLRIKICTYLKKNHMIQEIFNNKNFKKIMLEFWNIFVFKSTFIQKYYMRSENMWNDGFLFDFLQKKTLDTWVRRFVITTSFLFSERLVFEVIVKVYVNFLIWPAHQLSIFETTSVSEMLSITLFIYLSLYLLTLSLYLIFF